MKSPITFFLACYFLAGSVIFPLSDFSMLREIPRMYGSYCEIRAGEPSIGDFVADYLLHGRELFGNNAQDARPKTPGALQFQHQPVLSIFYVAQVSQRFTNIGRPLANQAVYHLLVFATEYHNEHFRPPIA